MGVTEQLSAFMVETKFEDIPKEAIRLSKRLFLDCLGTTLAGYKTEAGRIVTEYTREIGGSPQSRLVGSGVFTSAASAAFANGTMSHVLDFDDFGMSHPTVCIVPVVLALGEKLKLSGKEILTAQVVGYECFGKLSYGARPYEATLRGRGYHPTSIYGSLAAAAAAAKVLKLDVSKTSTALGLAGAQAAGLMEHFGTMGKGFHAGNSCRAGILAALLAQKGYTASQQIIEGHQGLYRAVVGEGNYDLKKVTENLGKTWEIITPGLSIKRHPSCGGIQRSLDAMLQVVQEHNISLDQVESVQVKVNTDLRNTVRFDEPNLPTNGYQGKFSFAYNMALALVDKKVDIDSFTDEKLNSSQMKKAISKVKIVDHPKGTPESERRLSPVTVRMKNGQEYTNVVENQKGHPQNPLTDEEVLAKYRYCAGRVPLPKAKVERAITLVQDMEKVTDITQLMDAGVES